MSTRHVVIETYLGPITIVAKDETITGLYFRHHVRRPPQEAFGSEVSDATDSLLNEAVRQLCDYLAGRRRQFGLPLAAEGDPFQHAVWDIVKSIQCGDTTTYGRTAEQVGGRGLAQQVGQAVGANPLCIFVPCHRVVGSSGSLTGYAGGLKRKQALLELEEPPAGDAGRLF
ncbi:MULTISPECIES: methylated-DNA--[protein]-cysteine S-methyltransferase [unclassified Streptomyces]|uniref:methylated-DNA--[protein]-cysteine S-methyltransferase n=1 Tax=unclassified Streptomyces TaxID=2593676 RepID=UPI000F5BE6D7|nr:MULTISPECIES: methylated-DNA--[protein]-cysteine S-methyltransferase [unclassified Streptomyces]RPK61909.1 Methylated-DNA--protein-cysteine methyltransferase [Streptomyces sp. ADI95-17]WSC25482.1 methylated-DNA--[protein]-cysteine S-methyltransferase [Streptomyces sp. NBC_01768]WSW99187.1 methylated-DNA--[protein]-cysteine S-methyltransferase [Streptomyces sp. NBC_00987]